MSRPSSPVDLGPLGFGSASIGNLYREVDEDRARSALEAAWDGGIRYFDTAPHYGLGLSERRLGAFLRERPRDEFVVSTKVGRLLEPNPDFAGGRDLANGFDVPDDRVRVYDPSPSGVRRSLEASLERMGLDRIDVLFLHDPDVYDLERGLAEGLPALATLRDEGLVGQIGIGVNDADVAARAVREGDLDLVMIAGRYTLLEQPALAELFPACQERGVRIVDAAVFNSGLLATATPRRDATYDYGAVPDDVFQRAQALAATCAEFGVELPAAALQFPLRHPLVATVVVGTSRPDAVRQNVANMSAVIPDELWSALEERGLIPVGDRD
ncbi:aldo/keto reductase [Agromyces cerinus]|uniref:D-threo-aldose 1-dehydrogenase n=1 Tax=Agromyces cerinus subsp. cerinus TaxID=232089 RepID=A0A1N6HB61_9MICO|nr:aldo/keto reductase [Agromyces cerinus]SIO17068.1 D-threo-aldose 1-dehydrogenase [Agromyces cerinus subsp. cerinus]